MSYIDPEWIENEQIKGDLLASDFDIEDCQRVTDNEIELRCLMTSPSIGVDDIPVHETTGYTTSPILMKYGRLYLTFVIARALRQAGSNNSQNDVYDGIMTDYYKEAMDVANLITYELVLNIDKDPVSKQAFMKVVPLY